MVAMAAPCKHSAKEEDGGKHAFLHKSARSCSTCSFHQQIWTIFSWPLLRKQLNDKRTPQIVNGVSWHKCLEPVWSHKCLETNGPALHWLHFWPIPHGLSAMGHWLSMSQSLFLFPSLSCGEIMNCSILKTGFLKRKLRQSTLCGRAPVVCRTPT